MAAVILSLAVSAIFLLPFCDLIYRCGCTFPWAGAADMCNIHIAGVPYCPWCVQRNSVLMVVPFLLIFIGQGGVIYYFHKHYHLAFIWLLLAGLFVFFVLGALHGYVFKVIDGYPYFF